MHGKDIIITGIWVFTIIILIGLFVTGVELEFFGYLLLLFVAFAFSVITELLLAKKQK